MRGALVFAMAVMSCGPTVRPQATTVARAKPPVVAPSGARWFIPTAAAGAMHAELATPEGTLLVGAGGTRFLNSADRVTNAETVLPETLRDVKRLTDGRFLFLGESGSSYLSRDALGAIETRRPGPGITLRGVVAAKNALIAVDEKGATHRSLDDGTSWSPLPIAWPVGTEAKSIGATRSGEVIVVGSPQRVMASTDDGATFVRVTTLGLGAESVRRSTDEHLFLEGFSPSPSSKPAWALLRTDPTRLEAGATPTRTELPSNTSAEWGHEHTLAGDRHVTLRWPDQKTVDISIAALGTSAAPKRFAEYEPQKQGFIEVAGHGNTVVMAHPGPPTMSGSVIHVKRTRDNGATWEALEFQGRKNTAGWPSIHVGPSDSIVLSGVCSAKDEQCGNHLYTNNAWHFLEKQKDSIRKLIVDSPRKRVLYDTGLRIFVDTTDFTNPRLLGEHGLPLAWSVDDAGVAWVIGDKRVRSFPADGSQGVDVPFPFADASVSLAGRRGLAISKKTGLALETSDGGVHWFKVTTPWKGYPQCSSIGCIVGDADRIGWDLPSSALEAVTASDPVKTKEPPSPSTKSDVKFPTLRCKASGKWTGILDDLYNGERSIAWTTYREDSDATRVAYGKGAAVADAWLLPAPKTKSKTTTDDPATNKLETRSEIYRAGSGVVAARFTFERSAKGSGEKNPVDVEIGWLSYSDGKAHHAVIKAVAPFRVARTVRDASFSVLDDGRVVFLAAGKSPVYLIDPSGKVEAWTRPALFEGATLTHAVLIGKKLLLVREDSSMLFAESADGKSWTERAWTTDHRLSFGRADGKSWLSMGWKSPERLYALEGLPLDPPDALEIPAAPLTWKACEPSQIAGLETWDLPVSSMEVMIDGVKTQLPLDLAYGRRAPSHAGCVVHVDARNGDQSATAFPNDLAHAWLFRGGEKREARPMTCAVVP